MIARHLIRDGVYDTAAAEPIAPGERPPVARLRLLTTGTLQPRFEIRVEGL